MHRLCGHYFMTMQPPRMGDIQAALLIYALTENYVDYIII